MNLPWIFVSVRLMIIFSYDVGLTKTLQTVTFIYKVFKTRITSNKAYTIQRAIVVCYCSLVKLSDNNEFSKWLGFRRG